MANPTLPIEFLRNLEALGWRRMIDFQSAIGSRFYLYRKGPESRVLIEVYPDATGFDVWIPGDLHPLLKSPEHPYTGV